MYVATIIYDEDCLNSTIDEQLTGIAVTVLLLWDFELQVFKGLQILTEGWYCHIKIPLRMNQINELHTSYHLFIQYMM